MTACTPGSAPSLTLGNEYGDTLPSLMPSGQEKEWKYSTAIDWTRCLLLNLVLDAVREDARRPEFTENLSRTIVVEGGPTKLECKLSGKPVPEVRWLKDRRPLGDDVSYEMACEEDELHTLCISATYAEHAGWYSCVARNDVGTAITEAKLTVERMYYFHHHTVM